MASDDENDFDEDMYYNDALGAPDDDDAASLEELQVKGMKGLTLADRPLTAAERDRRVAAVNGGGATTMTPHSVEVHAEIRATAAELDAMLKDGHLVLSTANNTIDPSRIIYSNKEDATDAMHALNNYQVLDRVQLNYFEHPYASVADVMCTIPSIKATPREQFARAAETKSLEAPHGVFAKTIAPTKEAKVLHARTVEQGTTDFCAVYAGHTLESVRQTFIVAPAKDFAAIQVQPIMSPLLPYYNMLAKPLNMPLVGASASAKNAKGPTWSPSDPELTQKASELCEQTMKEKITLGNYTDPKKMQIQLQPFQNRYNAARGMQLAQPVSFAALSAQNMFQTPSALALAANASMGGAKKAKLETYKKHVGDMAKPIRVGLTFFYYSFPPSHVTGAQ
jgi:hypothetical protein